MTNIESCILPNLPHDFQMVNKTLKGISILCTKCGLLLTKDYPESNKNETSSTS